MADRITKVTLLAQVSNYVEGFDKARKATQDTASEAEKAKAKLEAQSKIFDVTGKAALAFGAAAAFGVAAAVKAYADWDAKMAQVQSLSHAGVNDMNALKDATFGFAQQFGISASEASDAEIELVKGGVSVKDMINGALKGSLTLAAAGQIDVADATSIAVSAMTQFHLKGQDVSHIADLLAAGADKALGSVSDLGQGLKYVGPVASSMGISIESTVGVLSELAQNGILADQAGTGVRGMLQSLVSPSQQASAVMKQYGINLFDANGKFIGLAGAAQQLQDGFKGVSEAERDYALGQIFGNQQVTVATVLMEGGAKAVNKWTSAVNDQGFAAEQASGKMNSLVGNWTRLTATIQNDLVQTGSGSGGILNSAVKGATDLAAAYGNLPQPLKNVALGSTAAAAGVSLVAGAALLGVPKIVAFDAALATMGARPNLIMGGFKSIASFMTGPWGLGLAAGAAAIVGVNKALDSLKASTAEYQNVIKTGDADNLLGTASKGSINNIQQTLGLQKSLRAQLEDLTPVLNEAAKASKNYWDYINNTQYKQARDAIRDIGKQLAETAQTDLPSAQNGFVELAKGTDGTQKSLWRLLSTMPEFKAALTDQLTNTFNMSASKSNLLKLAMDQLSDSSTGAASSSTEVSQAVAQVQQSASDASSALSDLVQQLQNLDNGNIDAASASIAFQQAIDDATQAAKDNGATLDENTQKGRDNESSLLNIAKSAESFIAAQYNATAATGDMTKAQNDATASTQSARDEFIRVATAMTGSADTAAALADKYGLIPGKVTTDIVASGAATAASQAQSVADAVNAIPNVKTVRIQLSGDQGVKVSASTIMQRNGGILSAYADGGFENHVAQIAPAGAWRMWAEPETGGEAYIPLAPSKRSRSIAIWEETGRRLQAFAGGGFSGPTVNVASPSLDGLSIGGRLVVDASGFAQLMDARIYANASANVRTTGNGVRKVR